MNSVSLNTKWVSTVASIWIQTVSGSSYAFGIYSSVLKTTQDYNQSTLDVVSVFKDIGANAGILSGILYGVVSRKHNGPWIVHLAGAVQCFVGYFFIWAAVTGIISRPPVPVMCLFMFLAAHAQTFFNTANVVSGVQNFSDYGGTIVGIMKGFLGLSGAVLIQVYDLFFAGKPSTFLLILALLPTTVTLLLMFSVRIYETILGYEKRHLNYFSMISLITAAYLMVIIILQNTVTLQFWARIITFIILIILLVSPLRIAVKAQRDEGRYEDRFLLERNPLVISPEVGSSSRNIPEVDHVEYHELPGNSHLATNDDSGKEPEEGKINVMQAFGTVNFWLLFIAMLCGMGSGLATINNIGQIGQSLGYTNTRISSLVSLWSIWNFLGRFGAGYISDILLHNREWARPLFMVITLAAMTGGHIIIAVGFPLSLYIGSVLVGICYGSQWSLMPTITSEIFGVENMGTIFNTISIASPVGSYIFSVRVIGFLYDKEASAVDNKCLGTHCFMLSFLIMASVALFGSLIAFTLYMRTRKFYKQVILRRLKHTSSL